MAYATANDSFAPSPGLTPRYLRMRQFAAERAQCQAPTQAQAQAADTGVSFDDLGHVDAATAELRRRVAAACRPARHPSLMMTGSILAGLGFLLWQVVSNIADAMPPM